MRLSTAVTSSSPGNNHQTRRAATLLPAVIFALRLVLIAVINASHVLDHFFHVRSGFATHHIAESTLDLSRPRPPRRAPLGVSARLTGLVGESVHRYVIECQKRHSRSKLAMNPSRGLRVGLATRQRRRFQDSSIDNSLSPSPRY